MTETVPDETPADEPGQQLLSNWEFIGTPPTVEKVRELLATLPDVWGVSYSDYWEYVQALPSKKKIKVPAPNNPRVLVDEYVEVHNLYMSVAGRIKMMQAAADAHDWRVDFTPEPSVTTGAPGYLRFSERLVYRVYVEIYEAPADGAERLLGRKSGTAWVPETGGSQAAGSNPFEKCETSALGRALGAWGIGILPGSGVASVEEMQEIRTNRAYLEAVQAGQPAQASRRRPREELLQQALAAAEALRQKRGVDEDTMLDGIGKFLTERLGVQNVYDPVTRIIDWDRVKDGQLDLAANAWRESLRKLVEAESPV